MGQITQSALRTAEESFNILAGGKLKLGIRAARMVATGYQLSELFTQLESLPTRSRSRGKATPEHP